MNLPEKKTEEQKGRSVALKAFDAFSTKRQVFYISDANPRSEILLAKLKWNFLRPTSRRMSQHTSFIISPGGSHF